MKCIHCQGLMERATAPFMWIGTAHLVLDKIPAWVCGQCGEAYFEESEVDSIQAIIETVDSQVEKLATVA
ncbi:MAG TPA: YgiT-type zinc finger protein [Pyrinomonadaceae bacterium]|nr:YgiT-type zinc finger protein [Pyrinomonadaceae bacterium]